MWARLSNRFCRSATAQNNSYNQCSSAITGNRGNRGIKIDFKYVFFNILLKKRL